MLLHLRLPKSNEDSPINERVQKGDYAATSEQIRVKNEQIKFVCSGNERYGYKQCNCSQSSSPSVDANNERAAEKSEQKKR